MPRTDGRATAVVVKDRAVLLIHRIKYGDEYWVFPGGGIEEGETPQEAVKRELLEEVGLKTLSISKAGYDQKKRSYLFFCEVADVELKFTGSEAKSDSNNQFEPVWIPLSEIKDKPIYPGSGKKFLVDN